MNKNIFHVFVMSVLCCLLTTAALTSLLLPVCKDISEADPINVTYESCISTLGSDPRSLTSTAPQLATISFKLSITSAKAINSTIGTILNLNITGPIGENVLEDCQGIYSRVPGDLEAGLEAIKAGDFDTATSARVSAAINAATTCGNKIKERVGEIDPLRKKINDFHQLDAISFGFIKLLRIIN
ncbi:putative invertase inhibitor [Chenopodium quinoa]|uniref:putative invertase inhibitor n=1 Tax=Chenopodium quinoa TaxID=63459 RepID=UPI000B799089|nr:putative invertase inhibitor [Chenopodium quinoa]